jgi:hypothetical protein
MCVILPGSHDVLFFLTRHNAERIMDQERRI